MNPVVTLDDLANGVSSCERVMPLDPAVINALVASVQTQKTVNTISNPVVAKTIDNTTLGGGIENQTEFTFTNNTGVDITYWFTGLFNQPGDATDFGIAGNSAFDYPAASGSGPHPENGGSDLRVFNKKVIATGGFIVGLVEVTTSNTGTQKQQNLKVITENVANDPCAARRLAPICDACNNNANSETFTVRFKCPLAVGGEMSFGYTVEDGETVTVRVSSIGEAVNQYKTLGQGCGC